MHGATNIAVLLQARELGARSRKTVGNGWYNKQFEAEVGRWAEQDFVQRHCSAQYANLHHHPRSTIAAAFSPDGELIASTQ
jgi:hypothetical protein